MIRVENVSKHYGSFRAVDQVSICVEPGEIVGFLGPNGAGKSTLFKMISTFIPPSAGRIEVAGHDVVREPLAARASLGYLAEHNALYETMRVESYLRFVGRARGIPRSELGRRIGAVSERCELESVINARVEQCSKGFRQRIGVAAALLHDPPAIVLDEPTHGLDPLQVVAFRDFIKSLAENRAILFSSHIVSEVHEISERLLVIHHGKLLANQTVAELEQGAAAAGETFEQRVLSIFRGSAPSTHGTPGSPEPAQVLPTAGPRATEDERDAS